MGPQLTIFRVGTAPSFVVISGEIDVYTAPDLRGSLNQAVDESVVGHAAGGNRPTVTVDLAGVSFIDGRGLTVLAVAEAYACVRGVRLLFTGVSPAITRLLRITGLSLGVPGEIDAEPSLPPRGWRASLS